MAKVPPGTAPGAFAVNQPGPPQAFQHVTRGQVSKSHVPCDLGPARRRLRHRRSTSDSVSFAENGRPSGPIQYPALGMMHATDDADTTGRCPGTAASTT